MLVPFVLVLAGCGLKKAEEQTLSNPNDADAWESLGDAYRLQFRGQRAADAYREAMRIDPERQRLLARMPHSHSKAARDLRREASTQPNNDELWGDLGDLLRYEGDVLGARQAYLRAFRIDPSDSEWHNALIQLGSGDVILDVARSALNDHDDESQGDFGDLLAAMGRPEEACEHWRRAAELDPHDGEWVNHASDCGYAVPEGWETGTPADTGAAPPPSYDTLPDADDIPGLLQRRDSDGRLLVRLGQAYLMSGDRVKAEETLWASLLVGPTDEEALQSYLVATNSTRKQVLERLRAIFPDNDEIVGALADHYLDLGQRDRARELYALAHQLDDDDPEWRAKQALLDARP